MIPNRQRLAAVAVLGEREAQLSAVQRLALVDAAWWLLEPNGGEELAYALLAAACSAEVTTEHAYLALITPSSEPDDYGEGRSSDVAERRWGPVLGGAGWDDVGVGLGPLVGNSADDARDLVFVSYNPSSRGWRRLAFGVQRHESGLATDLTGYHTAAFIPQGMKPQLMATINPSPTARCRTPECDPLHR